MAKKRAKESATSRDDSVEDILIAGFAYYSQHSVAKGQRENMGVQSHRSRGKVGFVSTVFRLCSTNRSNRTISLFRFFHDVFSFLSTLTFTEARLSFTIACSFSHAVRDREANVRDRRLLIADVPSRFDTAAHPAISV